MTCLGLTWRTCYTICLCVPFRGHTFQSCTSNYASAYSRLPSFSSRRTHWYLPRDLSRALRARRECTVFLCSFYYFIHSRQVSKDYPEGLLGWCIAVCIKHMRSHFILSAHLHSPLVPIRRRRHSFKIFPILRLIPFFDHIATPQPRDHRRYLPGEEVGAK